MGNPPDVKSLFPEKNNEFRKKKISKCQKFNKISKKLESLRKN
jgi:hypothetical protein